MRLFQLAGCAAQYIMAPADSKARVGHTRKHNGQDAAAKKTSSPWFRLSQLLRNLDRCSGALH